MYFDLIYSLIILHFTCLNSPDFQLVIRLMTVLVQLWPSYFLIAGCKGLIMLAKYIFSLSVPFIKVDYSVINIIRVICHALSVNSVVIMLCTNNGTKTGNVNHL